jgi:hypothetical protein
MPTANKTSGPQRIGDCLIVECQGHRVPATTGTAGRAGGGVADVSRVPPCVRTRTPPTASTAINSATRIAIPRLIGLQSTPRDTA